MYAVLRGLQPTHAADGARTARRRKGRPRWPFVTDYGYMGTLSHTLRFAGPARKATPLVAMDVRAQLAARLLSQGAQSDALNNADSALPKLDLGAIRQGGAAAHQPNSARSCGLPSSRPLSRKVRMRGQAPEGSARRSSPKGPRARCSTHQRARDTLSAPAARAAPHGARWGGRQRDTRPQRGCARALRPSDEACAPLEAPVSGEAGLLPKAVCAACPDPCRHTSRACTYLARPRRLTHVFVMILRRLTRLFSTGS